MPHRHPHKPAHHVKPKYKKLALIAATAALLSATSLPGMPASTVHASANDMSATTSQQVGKTNDSSSRINAEKNNTQKSPSAAKQGNKPLQMKENNSKTPVVAPKISKETTQKNAATEKNETTTKTPAVTKKIVGETNEKTNTPQTKESNTKAPVAPLKETTENKEKTPPPQPSKDTHKDQITNSKPKEEKEETKSPTPANAPDNYKKVLDISATAYAPGPHDNGQWGTKTHIGTEVRPGIIAVDPKLIPLGSRVYIEYPDGHGEYATAEDTGGAIKGNRIDIAHQTVAEAEDFGIQKVKVYVVSSPKDV